MKKAGMDKAYYRNLGGMVIAGMLALTTFPSFAAPFAYLSNTSDIHVIDTATNTETATIAVFQVGKVAVHPSGDVLYGLKFGNYGGLLNVYDTSNNNLLAKIPIADGFRTMSHSDFVVHPSGDFVYVVSISHESTGNRRIISIVDTNVNAISATIELPQVSTQTPIILAIHPTGDFLYVAERSGGAITVFDTNTLQSVATIDADPWFSGLAIHPSGQYLYTSGRRVQVIDTTTNSVVDSVVTNSFSNHIKVHPDGNTIYVSHYWDSAASVIDANTNTVTTTISLPYYPNGIALHPSGDFLYMIGLRFIDGWESAVAVINTDNNQVAEVLSYRGLYGRLVIGPMPEPVGGTASGISSISVICTNTTSGQSVSIGLSGGNAWNCESNGLQVNDGDSIEMIVTGNTD